MASKFFKLADTRWINRDLVAEVILSKVKDMWNITYYFESVIPDCSSGEQVSVTMNFLTEEDARLQLERFIQGGLS